MSDARTAKTVAPKLFPIQAQPINRKPGTCREEVYMAAYEVYEAVHGPQPALIDLEGRNCRGGFGNGDLIAYLYARSFPRGEWRARFHEAIQGLNV